MQPARPQPRAPGSFSPLPTSNAVPPDLSRPRPRRVESSSSDEATQQLTGGVKARSPAATPIYASFTQHPNSSASSLQSTNFSRPTPALSSLATAAAARQVAANNDQPRTASASPLSPGSKGHARKHSQSAGLFDSTLPSTNTSNLSQIGMGQPPTPQREMSASQIAAQAAVMHHQNQQQQQQQQQQHQHQHARQRSQTVPVPGESYEAYSASMKRGSGGPLSPPMLSLTEASAPRDSGFGLQGYHNGLLGSHAAAAQAAANVVFPRSGQSSPGLPMPTQIQIPQPQQPPPPPPPPMPEKKPEKTKAKLFSRPIKIGTKGEPKEKPLPSPSKIGSALASLQRGNFSTTSLDSTAQSFYSLANSSAATIRPLDTPVEREGKEKEKKHHFLSRQKHKLKDKDDFHLPLSSASSNSRPTDPSAPSSLYNFNLPPSPGPNSNAFKSMSGLDLRHGGRALREKKREERNEASESTLTLQSEWPGPSSLTSATGQSSLFSHEPLDSGKYGLNNMSYDDAWPYLKAKLLAIFEGEDLRLPVEDFNRVVMMHIQFCIQRRSPNIIFEDLRELLSTGFASLDHTLRKTPEDRLIPALVELWLFTFTSILPYMQAVFLPLDLEFSGAGTLMSPEQARDFWGGVLAASPAETSANLSLGSQGINVSPVSSVLDIRRLVLTAYRDIVILPRYDTLKTIFSRLSLEFLPQSLASLALASPLPIQTQQDLGYNYNYNAPQYLSTSPSADSTGSFPRPGTAMSLDPSVASYNSNSTTLLGDGSGGGRSRAISNVSFGSGSEPRPFTPSSQQVLGAGAAVGSMGSLREQNVEDSKQVTEMVGRMLQCMSVLASVGVAEDGSDEGNKMVEELSRLLKLNWLGRGRTGRNRRGMVGGRRRGGTEQPVREEVGVV